MYGEAGNPDITGRHPSSWIRQRVCFGDWPMLRRGHLSPAPGHYTCNLGVWRNHILGVTEQLTKQEPPDSFLDKRHRGLFYLSTHQNKALKRKFEISFGLRTVGFFGTFPPYLETMLLTFLIFSIFVLAFVNMERYERK